MTSQLGSVQASQLGSGSVHASQLGSGSVQASQLRQGDRPANIHGEDQAQQPAGSQSVYNSVNEKSMHALESQYDDEEIDTDALDAGNEGNGQQALSPDDDLIFDAAEHVDEDAA